MKRIFYILIMLLFSTNVFAAKQVVNNGETMGQARTKINSNFTEVYTQMLVGDCTVGPCLDGTSDGGNYIKLYAGTGSYWTALQGGVPTGNRTWRLPIAAPPVAGATQVMTMDEYGNMAFIGLPDVSGKVLSSTTAGVLSWETGGGGAVAIDDLTDVDTTGKATGKVLKFNSSGNLIVGDDNEGSGSLPTCSIADQVPRWNGSAWGCLTIGTSANNLIALNSSGQLPFTIDLANITDTTNILGSLGGGASEIGDLSDWPSGLTATELGYVNGATSSLQGQINTLSAGAGGTVTVVTSDPYSDVACTGAKYNSANDRFFPCLGGYHTGYVGLTDFSNATPTTYTLTLDIIDGNATDSVTVNSTPRTTDGTWAGLSSATEPVTCTADTGRTASCAGTGITGSYPDYVADMTQNRSIACTFSAASCTTPATGDVFNEGFIGTGGANSGYENAGWTETVGTNGTVDQDYTLTGTGWTAGSCTEGLRTRMTAGGTTTYATLDLGSNLALTTSLDIYAELNIASQNLGNYSVNETIVIRDQYNSTVAHFDLSDTSTGSTFGYYVGTTQYNLSEGQAYLVKIHLDATEANSYIQVDGGTQRTFTRASLSDVRSIRIGLIGGWEADLEWGRVWVDRP